METINYKLEAFEGPLDLLLTLIAKNKVDISDIPIALILEQYLAAIDEMRAFDAEVSGEFIVMAAQLMLIKSRMLLPREKDKEEDDPRADLARALYEYKAAKEHAALLRDRYSLYAARIVKDTQVIDTSTDRPEGLDAALLTKAMNRILERNRHLPMLAKESEQAIRRLLETKIVPVGECVADLIAILEEKGTQSFEDILLSASSRSELVALFLALLELISTQRVKVTWPSEDDEEDLILFTLDREKMHEPIRSEFDQPFAESLTAPIGERIDVT